MFLGVLFCCIHIWRSSHLFQYLLVAFELRLLLVGTIYIWGLYLQSCMNTLVPHHFLSLWKFLSLYVFSRSYNSPGWLLEISLLFLIRWNYSSDPGLLSEWTSCLLEIIPTTILRRIHNMPAQCRGRYRFNILGIRSTHMLGWGDTWVRFSYWLMGGLPPGVLNAVSKNQLL